jgi:phosphoribosylamine---glycine ligase
MRILVIGSGGREHALCWKLRQSPKVSDLYCAPGNGGTAFHAENVELNITDHKKVIAFCKKRGVDLVVVGPEAPLAVGIADDITRAGINVFGPAYAAARLESSKIFAKEMMGGYNIPTAAFRVFDDIDRAEEYIMEHDTPVVVKAYGLASGKGVIVASTREEAVSAARRMLVEKEFGPAGQRIIVEEFLAGEEASILVLTDGRSVVPLAASQDHKRAYDGDTGPNTGGMGAYSPTPLIDDAMFDRVIETIVMPTLRGLESQKIIYRGVLYVGLMMTDDGPKVLEYNVRFGDPEAEVILPRMKSDLAELLEAVAKGELDGRNIEWDERECVSVVLASEGYPGEYQKGQEITGIVEAMDTGAIIFHAGTKLKGDKVLTSGGRVMNVVGLGPNIKEAIDKAYEGASKIHFDGMWCRRDIGHRALAKIKT